MAAKVQPEHTAGAADTSFAARQEQIRIWRSWTSIQIADLISGASRAARTLALAGLRARHPTASERELVARLAAMTIGRERARQVYADVDLTGP
jgi:hypothetical protein